MIVIPGLIGDLMPVLVIVMPDLIGHLSSDKLMPSDAFHCHSERAKRDEESK